jgi:hypothetical protein
MSARHPNRQRLQRWLETGETRRVSNHIERCDHCQEILEDISALDEGMVADLQAATTPPDDLRERTHGGVDTRLRNEAALGSFLDLFTIGWDVARVIIDPGTFDQSTAEPVATLGDDAHDDDTVADDSDGGAR